MWLYLFTSNEIYPDSAEEIRSLAELAAGGREAFLKLSDRDDAPLKRAKAGERVLLCFRSEGIWKVQAEAQMAGPAIRGLTPASVFSIYGQTGDRHWWRALSEVRVFKAPIAPSNFGVEERFLPSSGRAYVIRVMGDLALDPSDILIVRECSEDVTIDEQGRIFRYNGEEIIEPGLEPETILGALADVASGRMVSNDDLRAGRS